MQDSGINILFEGQNLQRILEGLGQTVFVAIISVVLSFILGLLVGMLMTSRNIVVRFVTRLYLEVVRIVPVLVMLYILYFGLTRWTGIHIDNRVIAIFVFTFWGTAEMADIVRASVTSIPKIQWESGQALGLTAGQLYVYVIIPQTVRRIVPPAINLATRMVKTTALLPLIGIIEVIKVGQQVIEVSVKDYPSASFWIWVDLLPVLHRLLPVIEIIQKIGIEMARVRRGEETLESPILKLKHVNKYYGETQALADIQLDVAKGEVVTIIGQSGCGKSTALRCINGLEQIQSGSILLDGKEIAAAGTNWKEVRQKIGMVFQKYDLFPHMTVLDNVLLAPLKVQKRKKEEAAEEAIALLKRVGLEDKAHSFPRQLSGGQQQRVAIVRALMTHPEIMLFDEVTAALDPEMIREVLNVILDLAKDGMTMLIVTHEMAFAEAVSDKIVFMEKGNIVEISDDPRPFFKEPQSQRANEFINTFRFQ